MRIHTTIRLLVVAALALSCAPREVVDPNGPVEIALVPYVGRLVTVSALAGNDTIRLILDTGAGETVINPSLAARLGCTPSGRSIGFRMDGERVAFSLCPDVTLTIGGNPFPHAQIGVYDVQAILPPGVPPVDGVLSLKTLAARPFTLRLEDRRLTLESRSSLAEQVGEMARLQSRIATGPDGDELTLFVSCRVDSGPAAWFLLDSGNLDRVQVAPHLTSARADSTWDAELTLKGLGGVRTGFRARDIIYDGALSEDYLRHWILTFDLATNGVWAKPVMPRSGPRPTQR